MRTNRSHFSVMWAVLSFFACLFISTALYAGPIANITYTEKEVIIKPVSEFKKISVSITGCDDCPVFTKDLTAEALTIPLSEFISREKGLYKLLLSTETDKTQETLGRAEDGREAKIYRLKETLNQTETFQVVSGKINTETIIEE